MRGKLSFINWPQNGRFLVISFPLWIVLCLVMEKCTKFYCIENISKICWTQETHRGSHKKTDFFSLKFSCKHDLSLVVCLEENKILPFMKTSQISDKTSKFDWKKSKIRILISKMMIMKARCVTKQNSTNDKSWHTLDHSAILAIYSTYSNYHINSELTLDKKKSDTYCHILYEIAIGHHWEKLVVICLHTL